MIRPQRRSFMPGTTARVKRHHGVEVDLHHGAQSSSVMVSMDCGTLVPALLMRMSTLPI